MPQPIPVHIPTPKLIPELDVDDLDRSLAFYVTVIGFRVLFARPAVPNCPA
jgi:catechol 2,3-dioxygenase-like lactoylglutathione lyase family enzyme